jgi:hypothetical protein
MLSLLELLQLSMCLGAWHGMACLERGKGVVAMAWTGNMLMMILMQLVSRCGPGAGG